jgi:hypothetical protein
MDPRIQILIRMSIEISWIRNTAGHDGQRPGGQRRSAGGGSHGQGLFGSQQYILWKAELWIRQAS